jgi:hypothetical protein
MGAVARILSHPFRLALTGAAATVEQDTDQADAEQIAVLALTVRGERPLVPGFGVTDPVGGGFTPAELIAGVTMYGPPRTISTIDTRYASDTEQVVEVVYE